MSDDGGDALTVIAFVGSAFSPYYRRSRGDPDNHCALNVVLYGPRASRWTMTERGKMSVERSRSCFRIGPSRLGWDGSALAIEVDEVCAPAPYPLKGRIVVVPGPLHGAEFELDRSGLHRWRPISPLCRVTMAFDSPTVRWQGNGYLDTNGGESPLEDGFLDWNWTRASYDQGVSIRYNVRHRDGGQENLALRTDADGALSEVVVPPVARLPRTRIWRMLRETTADYPVRVVKTLEDTPFYSRSIVAEARPGGEVFGIHESLSLRRFANPLVQAMLPFRMPRRPRYPPR